MEPSRRLIARCGAFCESSGSSKHDEPPDQVDALGVELAGDLARLVVPHGRSDLARERHGRGREPDLAVLVLDVELDRVQPLLAQRDVLVELAVDRRERHGHVDAAHLVGERTRLGQRRGLRLRSDRRGRLGLPGALVAGDRLRADRDAEDGRERERDHRQAAPPAVCGVQPRRLARKRSFGSSGSKSIDTGAGTLCGKLGFRNRNRMIGRVVCSDRTIRRLLEEGRIEIDPYDESLMQPSSVDVRVDRYFRVFRNSRYPYIDVKQEQEELTELVEIDDEAFILHPGEFVLGSTLERVRLPDDLVARLEGKSSSGAARPAHPLDRRLHRPGLGRPRHARALERRQPPDHDLPRHEDRPALVRPADASRRRRRTARARWARSTRARRGRRRAATGRTSR